MWEVTEAYGKSYERLQYSDVDQIPTKERTFIRMYTFERRDLSRGFELCIKSLTVDRDGGLNSIRANVAPLVFDLPF